MRKWGMGCAGGMMNDALMEALYLWLERSRLHHDKANSSKNSYRQLKLEMGIGT